MARAFATPKIAVPVIAYVALLVGCVALAARFGIWTANLVTPTAFWFVLTGMVLFVNMTKAGEQERYFRSIALKTISLAAFIEFFYGAKTFHIIFELLLQPVVVLLACVPIVAAKDPAQRAAKRAAEVLLAVVGLSLALLTVVALWRERDTINVAGLVRQLALPIWLTLVSIPFLYLLSLVAEYESAALRMKIGNGMRRPGLRPRLALALELRADLRLLHRLTNYWGGRIAKATSLSAARSEARAFRDDTAQKDTVKREEGDRLIRNAGLPGHDQEGRRFDRREFKETNDALHWLASCHMGWYRREQRYRDDLLTIVGSFEQQGLPADHGVQMYVREDGQAWYAYRRTITGWVFGIGAAGPPPDQRFYDGAEPPAGFPGETSAWGSQPHEQGPKWFG